MDSLNIKVVTSDGVEHIISEATAEKCQTIKTMIDDGNGFDESDEPLPLPSISSEVLSWIESYCDEHKNEDVPTEEQLEETKRDEITGWDSEFINGLQQHQLFDLIMAANYIDCSALLNLACKRVAFMIKGKTPQEIRDTFDIENDFTPEEEEQIKRENEWCEEKP